MITLSHISPGNLQMGPLIFSEPVNMVNDFVRQHSPPRSHAEVAGSFQGHLCHLADTY